MKRLWILCILGIAAHAQVVYPATTTKAPQFSWAYYTRPGTSFQLGGSTPAATPAGVPQVPCQTPSGGLLTTPGNCLPGINGRAITGTTNTDTILATDCNPFRVAYVGSVAVGTTLPTATTFGVPQCSFKLANRLSTVNDVTVTPTTWTVNGNATLALHNGQDVVFFIDPSNATNWHADVHDPPATAGVGVSLVRTAYSLTISNSVQSYNSGSISASVGATNIANSANFPTGQYILSCDVAVTAVGASPTLAVTIGWTDITGTARTKTCVTGVVGVSDNTLTQTITSNGSAAITITQTLAVSTATWWATAAITRTF